AAPLFRGRCARAGQRRRAAPDDRVRASRAGTRGVRAVDGGAHGGGRLLRAVRLHRHRGRSDEVGRDPAPNPGKEAGVSGPAFDIVALDLDGTLLTSDKRLCAEDASALREATTRGVRVVLATARP